MLKDFIIEKDSKRGRNVIQFVTDNNKFFLQQ